MYKATWSTGEAKPKKATVAAPEEPALFSRDGGRQQASPFALEMLRRWLGKCLEAFPDAPRDWRLVPDKSMIVEGHVYLVIEEPGGGIPELVAVKDNKGKPTGEFMVQERIGKRASFLVKLKD